MTSCPPATSLPPSADPAIDAQSQERCGSVESENAQVPPHSGQIPRQPDSPRPELTRVAAHLPPFAEIATPPQSPMGTLFEIQVAPPSAEVQRRTLPPAISLLPSAEEARASQSLLGAPDGVHVCANPHDPQSTGDRTAAPITNQKVLSEGISVYPPVPCRSHLVSQRKRGCRYRQPMNASPASAVNA